jgi:hypothetical protein
MAAPSVMPITVRRGLHLSAMWGRIALQKHLVRNLFERAFRFREGWRAQEVGEGTSIAATLS